MAPAVVSAIVGLAVAALLGGGGIVLFLPIFVIGSIESYSPTHGTRSAAALEGSGARTGNVRAIIGEGCQTTVSNYVAGRLYHRTVFWRI